jgi:hypothetical protein
MGSSSPELVEPNTNQYDILISMRNACYGP